MRCGSCRRNWKVFVRPESCINYSFGVGYEIQMSEQRERGRFLSQNIFSPPSPSFLLLPSRLPRSSPQVKPLGWPLMQSFTVKLEVDKWIPKCRFSQPRTSLICKPCQCAKTSYSFYLGRLLQFSDIQPLEQITCHQLRFLPPPGPPSATPALLSTI